MMPEQQILECVTGKVFCIERPIRVHSSTHDGTLRNFLIYLAHQKLPGASEVKGQQVIIKIPNLDNRQHRRAIEMAFERERDILKKLDEHPNIVRLLDHGILNDADHTPYLLLGYIDGENIEDLRAAGMLPLSLPQVLAITSQLTDALAYLHRLDILHGDLKLSNIMVDYAHHRIILIDFGTAWRPDMPHRATPGTTPRFAAPEQFSEDGWDETTDLHALAAVLFQLLTNEYLFPRRTMESILNSRSEMLPPEHDQLVRLLRPTVGTLSDRLAKIILDCVHQEQKQRGFTSAKTLLEAIRQVTAQFMRERGGLLT